MVVNGKVMYVFMIYFILILNEVVFVGIDGFLVGIKVWLVINFNLCFFLLNFFNIFLGNIIGIFVL